MKAAWTVIVHGSMGEVTVAATVDPAANQYIYVWKTEKSLAGTCRQLVVKLKDGTYHRANFKFTR